MRLTSELSKIEWNTEFVMKHNNIVIPQILVEWLKFDISVSWPCNEMGAHVDFFKKIFYLAKPKTLTVSDLNFFFFSGNLFFYFSHEWQGK